MNFEVLRNLTSSANPANIPNEFIISAVVFISDGEPQLVDAEEMKEILAKATTDVRVCLTTDIRAMANYIDSVVNEVLNKVSA